MHVIFVPLAPDEIISALRERRGDIAAANLTITPERQKQVDFSDPIDRDVSGFAIAGPGAPPIANVEDLSGKVGCVRKSSSFSRALRRSTG